MLIRIDSSEPFPPTPLFYMLIPLHLTTRPLVASMSTVDFSRVSKANIPPTKNTLQVPSCGFQAFLLRPAALVLQSATAKSSTTDSSNGFDVFYLRLNLCFQKIKQTTNSTPDTRSVSVERTENVKLVQLISSVSFQETHNNSGTVIFEDS